MSAADAAWLLAEARRHDPERTLCALFAPAEPRAAALALLVLNQELARIPELVTQPMAGLIRYQWWREALAETAAGRPRAHPVLRVLAAPLQAGRLDQAELEALITTREQDLDRLAPADLDALVGYAAATGGRLQALQLRVLAPADAPGLAARAQAAGTAFALVGTLRAVAFHARHGRPRLPRDLIAAAGLEVGEILAAQAAERLAPVVRAIAARAAAALAAARTGPRPPRAALPALLPARLAALHLHRLRRVGHDLRAPELAERPQRLVPSLLWAAVTRYP